ncbi:MAG: hypothetical protein ABL927_07400, partial [Bdellovibrionales bacterium]
MISSELLPITKEIFHQMQQIAWLMIGPLFLLSCALAYMKEPLNFPALEMIHRLVVAIALLMFFPEITSVVSSVANGLAEKIGDKHALDLLYQKIQEQTKPDNQTSHLPFLISSDIGVAILNYLSYAVVY